jgi:hypothetical protein
MDPIIDFLVSAVDTLGSYISAIFQYLVNLVEYVTKVLVAILTAIVEFLLAGFKIILSFITHAVSDLIHGRFADLWDDYVKFRDALNAWLAPLRQLMAAYQQWIHQLYSVYLAPILNFLQNMRKVLAVFRAMGFKWAAKLDNYIAGIEGKIIGAFDKVVAAINRHADILYLLTSPLGFLRIVPLLHSLALSAEDLSRLFTLRPLMFWYGSGPTGRAGTLPTTSTHAAMARIATDARNGTGDAGAWQQSFTQLGQSWQSELGS